MLLHQKNPPSGYSPYFSVSNTSATQINGGTTIYFSRLLNAGAIPITENSSSIIIGAYSQGNSDTFEYHGSTHTSPGSIISINFYTGATSQSTVLGIRDAHSIIMLLSWGLILPLGLLAARYLRSFPDILWFKIHRPFQYFGTVLGLVGIIIGYSMVGPVGQFNHVAHAVIGTIIMTFSVLQVVVAFFRPHKEPEKPVTKERIAFEIFHHWNGRLLVLLAVLVQIFLGLAIDYQMRYPWLPPLYGAIVGTTLLIVLIAEIVNCIRPFGKLVPCFPCLESKKASDFKEMEHN